MLYFQLLRIINNAFRTVKANAHNKTDTYHIGNKISAAVAYKGLRYARYRHYAYSHAYILKNVEHIHEHYAGYY